MDIGFYGAVGSACISKAEGTLFESHCGQEFFILHFSLALCSVHLKQPRTYEINQDRTFYDTLTCMQTDTYSFSEGTDKEK